MIKTNVSKWIMENLVNLTIEVTKGLNFMGNYKIFILSEQKTILSENLVRLKPEIIGLLVHIHTMMILYLLADIFMIIKIIPILA